MEKAEVDRLVVEMGDVAKRFAKARPQTLVVLDGSARPLGIPMKKILNEVFGQKVRVVFISPSCERRFENPLGLKNNRIPDSLMSLVRWC